MPPDRNPARVHRIGPRIPPLPQQQVEQLVDGRQPTLMVEPAEILRVAEPPRDLWLAEPRLERFFGSGAAQETGERLVASRCGFNDRPPPPESAPPGPLPARHDLALEPLPI